MANLGWTYWTHGNDLIVLNGWYFYTLSDISVPFGTEISLFGDKISLNNDISVPNDIEISL